MDELIGKVVKDIIEDDDELTIIFEDNTKLTVCPSRTTGYYETINCEIGIYEL